ncbi:hypothetical protein HPB50_015617 [Hyalomma asiaticum]|uniref:Uncharacterized protein n=1 Tax=Hyalomma asiaticum TaxID=266040 RepID=A0ACB7SYP2_HYAAI|nr:hypothetical protein HPB50_015617 [Hyalomma asiaticum]
MVTREIAREESSGADSSRHSSSISSFRFRRRRALPAHRLDSAHCKCLQFFVMMDFPAYFPPFPLIPYLPFQIFRVVLVPCRIRMHAWQTKPATTTQSLNPNADIFYSKNALAKPEDDDVWSYHEPYRFGASISLRDDFLCVIALLASRNGRHRNVERNRTGAVPLVAATFFAECGKE